MTDHMGASEAVADGCPLDRVIRLLSGEWTAHILWKLSSRGPTRFGALRRELGAVSAKVLTAKLRRLESVGLVRRYEEPTVPPQVTYALTDLGQQIDKLLTAFEEFASVMDAAAALAQKASIGTANDDGSARNVR